MMGRDEVLDRLARGRDKWFWSVANPVPHWMALSGWRVRIVEGSGEYTLIVGLSSMYMYEITEQDWRERRIELGLEKRPEPDVTPEEDDAWNDKRMDAIGQNGNDGLSYRIDADGKVAGLGFQCVDVDDVGWGVAADTGAHYRYSHRAKVSQADADRGYVDVKLDPYRICSIYQVGGGPREHIVKKGLRGLRKGDTERGLIKQLRDALDRWEEMLDEDEGK